MRTGHNSSAGAGHTLRSVAAILQSTRHLEVLITIKRKNIHDNSNSNTYIYIYVWYRSKLSKCLDPVLYKLGKHGQHDPFSRDVLHRFCWFYRMHNFTILRGHQLHISMDNTTLPLCLSDRADWGRALNAVQNSYPETKNCALGLVANNSKNALSMRDLSCVSCILRMCTG